MPERVSDLDAAVRRVKRVLAGEAPDTVICNEAGDAFRARYANSRVSAFITVGDLRTLLAALAARPAIAEPVAWELGGDSDKDKDFATIAITEAGRLHALATGRTVRRILYTTPPAAERDAARLRADAYSEAEASVCPEDFGVVETVTGLRAELATLRETLVGAVRAIDDEDIPTHEDPSQAFLNGIDHGVTFALDRAITIIKGEAK